MNRAAQSMIAMVLGGALLGVTLTGRFTSYVRPGLGPLLLIAGAVLVLVGLLSLVEVAVQARHAHQAGAASSDDAHGHDHGRSRSPWLILAPIFVLLLVAPPALGAEAVTHNAGSQAVNGIDGVQKAVTDAGYGAGSPTTTPDKSGAGGGGYAFNDGSGSGEGAAAFAQKRPTRSFPALPGGKDPQITLYDFIQRALYDADSSVVNTPVTVTAFVAPAGDGFSGGYTLARLKVSCCAADATPMQVHVDGSVPLPVNTWVTAVVTAQDGSASAENDYVPTVNVTTLTTMDQPSDPYEH